MKCKVSKVLTLILFSSFLIFSSCRNIFEDSVNDEEEEVRQEQAEKKAEKPAQNKPAKKPVKKVSFGGSLTVQGAIPSQIDEVLSNQNTSQLEASYQEIQKKSLSFLGRLVRSARPEVPTGSEYEFYVTAFTKDGTPSEEVICTRDPSTQEYTYGFMLEPGHVWYFTAGFRRKAEGENPEVIFMLDLDTQKGEPYHHDFGEGQDLNDSKTFILGPQQSDDGKGSLDLELTADVSYVDSVKLYIPDSQTGLPLEWDAGGNLNITKDAVDTSKYLIKSVGADTETHSVSSGVYDVSIIFYKSYTPAGGQPEDAYDTPVYTAHQTINVFDNMTTNTWINENDDSSGASKAIDKATRKFNVSETLVKDFTNTSLYVGNPIPSNTSIQPDDGNAGSPFEPLESLGQAFNLIEAKGLGADYHIYISGTQRGSFTIPESINGKASSIEITTANKNARASLDGASTNASVLTVNSSVPVKISNLKIINGGASGVNGGGINIPETNTSAKVTLDTGTQFIGNSAAKGAGVYLGGGELILKGCPELGQNDIFLAGEKTVTVKGLTGSTPVAAITQENWKRHSEIITGSGITAAVKNRFSITANPSDEWEMNYTSSSISVYAPIYVGTDGDDGTDANPRSGTKTQPFASLARACREMNDSSKAWEININGTVSGAQTISSADAAGAASIIIQGSQDLDYHNNPLDKIDAGSDGSGSALTIDTSVPVTIKKLLITGGNTTGDGGGINVTAANAQLYLANDAQIRGNEADGNGGGVNLGGASSKLFMYSNSVIGKYDSSNRYPSTAEESDFGNKAANGGGLYIGGVGASAYIGAKGFDSNGDVQPETSDFCKIYGNYSANGGGIYNAAGIVKLYDRMSVSYNRATASGGGLYIADTSASEEAESSTGGSFHKNAAVSGGGVYICEGAAFTLSGGIGGNDYIYYNTATNGGAVYNAGTFTMGPGAFVVYGNAPGTNDVYLANVSGTQKTITLATTEIFTSDSQSNFRVGVTIPDWLHGRGKQILSTTDDITIDYTLKGKFKTTETGWNIKLNDDDTATAATIESPIYVASEGYRYVCSAPSDNASGSSGNPFKTIAAACVLLEDKDTQYEIKIDGEIVGPQTIPAALKDDGTGAYKAKLLSITSSQNNSTKGVLNGGGDGELHGSALTVESDVPVRMYNLTLTGGNAEKGGGLYVASGAKVAMASGTIIKGNKASANGGGVYVAEGGTAYFYSGNNSNVRIGNINANANSIGETDLSKDVNTAVNGAGVYNEGTCWFGGSFDGLSSVYLYLYGNTASGSGGAVYNAGNLNFYTTCYTRYNKAGQDGGGFYNAGSVTCWSSPSVCIENNKADRDGGGIYITSGKGFGLKAGTIKSNEAVNNGGGIYNAGSLDLTYSITFTLNNAKNGGGLYNVGSCTFSAGSIGAADAYNTAGSEGKGGAVYVCSGSTFSMESKAYIPYGNAVNTNDVYLEKTTNNGTTTYATINIAGNLTNTTVTTVAAITPAEWKRGTPILSSSSAIASATPGKFVMSQDDFDWDKKLTADSKSAYITMPVYVASSASDDTTRKRCNPAPDTGANGTASKPYATIAAALAEFTDTSAEAEITIDGNVIGAQTIGTVNASKLTLTGYIDTANGATASQAKLNGNNVSDRTTLTVNASSADFPVIINNLMITGGKADNGAGINITKGTVKLTDGAVVTGNTATGGDWDVPEKGNGGGVYVGSNGSLFMYGKALIGDSATATGQAYANEAYRGAGIYNDGGAVYIGYDTSSNPSAVYSDSSVSPAQYYGIRRNKTDSGGYGAAIYHKSGTLKIASGDISYNTTDNYGTGGAIYSLADAAISGGTITHNYGKNGGALYIKSGEVTLSGNTLKLAGNQAALNGGAIYNEGTLTLNGGTIGASDEQNYVSSNYGGAVYNNGTFNIGGTNVSINPGSEKTNDIYIAENKPLTITDTLPTGAQISITPDSFTRGKKLIMTSAAYADELAKFKVTKPADATNNEWRLYKPFADGTDRWARLDADLWVASAGSSSGRASSVSEPPSSGRNGTKAKPYATIDEALAQVWDDGTNKTVDFTVNISGSLSDAQTIADTVTKAKSIKLLGDANAGKTEINGGNEQRNCPLLTINTAVPVTIQNLTITGGNFYSNNANMNGRHGAGIRVEKAGASLTLTEGAVVTGNKTDYNGGGIYVKGASGTGNNATLIMNSTAQISNNYADDGCGVYLEYADMCMSGQAVVGKHVEAGTAVPTSSSETNRNHLGEAGGIYINTNSSLYLGYSRPENTNDAKATLDAGYGVVWNFGEMSAGGILNGSSGTIYMASGDVSYNSSNYTGATGGGILNYGTMYMYGGTIAGNYSKDGGGGIYNETNSNFYMSGGIIGAAAPTDDNGKKQTAQNASGKYSNYTDTKGGGIYHKGTTLSITGGTIEYNCAGYSGGGIYLDQKSASLTGSDASHLVQVNYNYAAGNNSSSGGGGLHAFNCDPTLENVSFTGNKANNGGSGGAVFVYGSANPGYYMSVKGKIDIPYGGAKLNNDVSLGCSGSNRNYVKVTGALADTPTFVATLTTTNSGFSASFEYVQKQGSSINLEDVAGRFSIIDPNATSSQHYMMGGNGKPKSVFALGTGSNVTAGKIILNNGYVASATNLSTTMKQMAVAVIFYKGTGLHNDGVVGYRILGLGLEKTAGPLCKSGSQGTNKRITDIESNSNTPFSGTVDGTNNGQKILDAVTDDSEENYPAIYYANNYSSHVTNLGDTYQNGWYIPSIAEVHEIYNNISSVNEALTALRIANPNCILSSSAPLHDGVSLCGHLMDDESTYTFSRDEGGEGRYYWPIKDFYVAP